MIRPLSQEVARAAERTRAWAAAARRAGLRLRARAARRVPWRGAADVPNEVRLDDVRRRLELLLRGLYGREIRVDAVRPRGRESVLHRLVYRRGGGAAADADLATAEGDCVRLPVRLLPTPAGAAEPARAADAALARFRLLAVQQGERVARGTGAHAPSDATPLERDLYLLCEAAAIDRRIASTMGGVRPALADARAAELAARPLIEGAPPLERAVEGLMREVLARDPGEPPPAVPVGDTPADSRAWARATAARLRALHPVGAESYRGVTPVGIWGAMRARGTEDAPSFDTGGPTAVDIGARRAGRGADDPSAGANSGAASDGGATSAAAPNASPVPPAPRGARVAPPHLDPVDSASAVVSLDAAPGAAASGAGAPAGGVPYPEWDHAAGRLVPRAATVLVAPPAEGDGAWAERVLGEHAALVRRVREQFERLRSRRTRLGAQRDGEELDLAACVRALAERRAGADVDDRLYAAVRPARRALAIALLVDVSGSTDTPVDGARSVIDVEKEAVLLAGEALDALGDRYAVLTFASRGARAVRVTEVKGFAERSGDVTRRRLAAVSPGGNTRMGAAVRHATALLEREPAGHRLLLILSDGKPSDTDGYHDRYGVEDTRQAVLEARARGVFPYCLTVDRQEPEYLSTIFGRAGHTILRRPEQLPGALVGVVRQLLRGR